MSAHEIAATQRQHENTKRELMRTIDALEAAHAAIAERDKTIEALKAELEAERAKPGKGPKR